MLKTNKQEVGLIERVTFASPNIVFKSVDEAIDHFKANVTKKMKAFGSELEVRISNGKMFLLLNRDNHLRNGLPYMSKLRDAGLEGILLRNGMGLGAFSINVADDDLITYNINYLFSQIMPNEEFTLIADIMPDGSIEIKSVMSGKFGHINNLDVLNVIADLDIPYEIKNLSLNKDFFRVNVINPENKVEAVVGDISAIGIDLLNSETGHAFLSMGEYIYRYWCANGCSHIDKNASVKTKAMHRGDGIKEVLNDFRISARHYLQNGVDTLKKNFDVLLNTNVTDKVLDKITNKVEKVIGLKNTEKLVGNWELFTGIKESHESEWNGKPMVEYDNNTDGNAYNLAQLVTYTAKDTSFFNSQDAATGETKTTKNMVAKQLKLEGVGGWMYHNASALA